MKKGSFALITAIAALLLVMVLSIQQPLRLHVIANSDSRYDQSTKLAVRDCIINTMSTQFRFVHSRDEAKKALMNNGSIIQSTVDNALSRENAPYGARISLGRRQFPDKTYGDTFYPAGEYDALCVTLGDGQGQNWWCVLYPPLCLGSFEKTDDVEFQSFIAELIKKCKDNATVQNLLSIFHKSQEENK